MQFSTIKTLSFLSAFAFSAAIFAQQSSHAPHKGCSVGLEDGALIKDRMLRQRAANPQVRSANMLPTYIPVAVTSVANTSGVGHANVNTVLAMLCDMNADYADQNVHFFLKDSIRYRQNDNMYNNAGNFASATYMSQNKVPNALNIYLSNTVQNSVASFYSPAGDYVFIITSEGNGTSNTATHEVGHFFSLNHTFYGWEGIAYHTTYQGQNAPNSLGGRPTERVLRSGTGSNCATAADGFCDTPADFISDRWLCPYIGDQGVLAKDAAGVDINPDESNYMSYFADACVNNFTTEQKAAILVDLQSRGWSNLAMPTPNNAVAGASVVATAPINNQVLLANGSNTIQLQWQAVTGATMYVVDLERTLLGQAVSTVFSTLVVGRNNYSFNTSVLPTPPANGTHDYRWSVKPLNSVNLCGSYSSFFEFKTSRTGGAVGVETQTAASSFRLSISPNPVEDAEVRLLVAADKAQKTAVRLYAPDGKCLLEQRAIALQEGENLVMLDASTLAAGLYIVVLTDENGQNTISRFVRR